MWFTQDFTPDKGNNAKTPQMIALRPFVVAVAATLLWMTGTQPIANANKLSRQPTSSQRSGTTQKTSLPNPPKPSPPKNVLAPAQFTFLKNTAGNAVLACDTSTGTVRRAELIPSAPPPAAAGRYVFIDLGRDDIKACNVMTGRCYPAQKSLN